MRRRMWIGLFTGTLLFSGATWAAEDDGPGPGVVRISVINGDVSVRRGDNGDWIAAAINTPVVAGDHVLTGTGSRAELQFDYANMLRLSSNAEVRLANLENGRYQVQLARGTATMSVLRDSNVDFELDTPNVSVRPKKRGDYRITVREDGETEVAVRSGEAEAFTPSGVERLRPGRTMLVRGTAANPEYQVTAETPRDEWDQWNEQRDTLLDRSRAYQYVSRDVYGADDLDTYGRWVYVPPYGWVWQPYSSGPDWAPYRYGRWSWVDYYGWTWIDNAPWGWAPYHYGRWFWNAGSWCWWPGGFGHRHYWRPALVAFFGFGAGPVHVGIGFGRVGWVPLAPYEPFYPWYGRRMYGGYRNNTYIDNSVRVVNNINITNVYRNSRVMNGVSGLDSSEFVQGRGGRAIRMNEANFQRASLVQGAVPITPDRQSLRVSDREARVTAMDRGFDRNRFYSRQTAPALERASFEQQRQGMDRMVRRTFGESVRTEAAGGQAQPGAGREAGMMRRSDSGVAGRQGVDRAPGFDRAAGPANRTESPAANSDTGWRRMGEPRQAGAESDRGFRNMEQQPGRNQAAPDAGWRRFGAAPENRESQMQQRETQREMQRQDRGVQPQRSNENWQRFGTSPSAAPAEQRPSERRMERAPGNAPRESNDSWNRFGSGRTQTEARPEAAPRNEMRSEPRWSGSERLNLNPPIVRERSQQGFQSAPRMERSTPAPRMERSTPAPRMERSTPAPRMERSTPAPRSEGGGGRSSGGGGGGGRTERSGGGGRHGR